MTKVESGQAVEFHPNANVREIIDSQEISEDEKKRLIASLGPDAGVFEVSREVSEAK